MPAIKSPRGAEHIEPLPRPDEIPQRHEPRSCEECGRPLCSYNSRSKCWSHEQIGEPVTLADLMRQAS